MKTMLVLSFAMCPTIATAASLPERFQGVWEDGITVSKEYADGGAWHCKFDRITVDQGGMSPVIIDMTCESRHGKPWKTHEVWSVQKIANQKVLIRADTKSITVYEK